MRPETRYAKSSEGQLATTSTTLSSTEATCLKTDIGNVHPRLGVGFRNKQGHILFSEAKDHS